MISPIEEHPPGRLRQLLKRMTATVSQYPWITLALVAFLCAVSLGVTFRFLTFRTDRSDLIAPDSTFHQRWLRYRERFGDQSDVIVVVESADRQQLLKVVDEVGSRLDREPNLFSRVVYRIDPSPLRKKSLQFLSPAELEQLESQLTMYGPVLDGHWDRAGLESYCTRLSIVLEAGQQGGLPEAGQDSVAAVLEHARLLTGSLDRFITSVGERFESPWPVLLDRASSAEDPFAVRYQTNEKGTMGFVLATPINASQDFSGSSRSMKTLRRVIDEVQANYPGVSIGMTGIPVLETDEMRRSQADMTLASLISLAGVGIILLTGFRGFRHPFLAILMLGVGISWSIGYTTIAVGHLNILSVSFAAILIGLGIDFAVIYLTRYVELRHQGLTLTDSLVKVADSVGTAIITAAVTTSLAFLCATFTNFLGVAELGIIAGGGVVLCAAAAIVVLPALVTVADRKVEPRRMATPFQGHWLRKMTQRFPGVLAGLTAVLICLLGMQGFEWREGRLWSRVKYDSNLLNLQADGLESVELQQKIFHEADGSLLYAVTLTDSPETARRLHEQFLELPTVKKVDDLASLMPRYPASETGLLVQAIHTRLSNLSSLPRQFPQLDPLAIGQALERLYLQLRDRPEPPAAQAANSLDHFLTILENLELVDQVQLLSGYQHAMLTALHTQFQMLAEMSDPQPVTPADFPVAIRSQFVSDQGDWLLRIYPAQEIWDEKPLAEFVREVRSVDPEVTGTPLQNFEAARQIRESYLNAAIYALAVIWLVLLVDALEIGPAVVSLLAPLAVVAFAIATVHGPQQSINPIYLILIYISVAILAASIFDFVSVRNTLLTLLPPMAGLFLMFGLLAVLKVDLNPANLIVLPLILGIGVDYGVHVVHDFRMQPGRYRTTPSTINAVIITSLTSMMGFGSMLVSAHQGLRSLAVVLLVGVGSCLFVSLVTLPAILTLIARDRTDVPPEGVRLYSAGRQSMPRHSGDVEFAKN